LRLLDCGPNREYEGHPDPSQGCRIQPLAEDAANINDLLYSLEGFSDETCGEMKNVLMDYWDAYDLLEWTGECCDSDGFHDALADEIALHYDRFDEAGAWLHEAAHAVFGLYSEPEALYWGPYCAELMLEGRPSPARGPVAKAVTR
jgi:hypothetical protein